MGLVIHRLSLIGKMNSSLALPAVGFPAQISTQSAHGFPFGFQSRIAVADGTIAAFLALVACDPKNGTATYAIRLLNDTAGKVSTRLWCVTASNEFIPAYPRDFIVAPFCHKDELVPVRLNQVGRFERVVLEVASLESQFTIEAPAPSRPHTQRLQIAAAAVAAILLLGMAALAVPRIEALSAPAKAFSGGLLRVPYVASGLGTIDYELLTKDGAQLAAGLAGSKSGVLRFTVPRSGAGAPYTLHLRLHGAFLTVERTATVAAAATVPPIPRAIAHKSDPSALIDELSVDTATVKAGSVLRVS